MTLLVAMLPFYLFGNLHCLGMCGPLVLAIGSHRYRYFYFFGRLLSFSLAGMLAGEVGAVLNVILSYYHLPALASLLFGSMMASAGIFTLTGWSYPGYSLLAKWLAPFNQTLSVLMLRDLPLATFLFGFFTVILPCGQTLVVFSACALSASAAVGFLNGFVFALLTSPALLFAMEAHALLARCRKYYRALIGWASLFIGLITLCRGLAELQLIPHLLLHLPWQQHLVIY